MACGSSPFCLWWSGTWPEAATAREFSGHGSSFVLLGEARLLAPRDLGVFVVVERGRAILAGLAKCPEAVLPAPHRNARNTDSGGHTAGGSSALLVPPLQCDGVAGKNQLQPVFVATLLLRPSLKGSFHGDDVVIPSPLVVCSQASLLQKQSKKVYKRTDGHFVGGFQSLEF